MAEGGERGAHGLSRIGEVAALTVTTPRTIRYYEEITRLETELEEKSSRIRARLDS